MPPICTPVTGACHAPALIRQNNLGNPRPATGTPVTSMIFAVTVLKFCPQTTPKVDVITGGNLSSTALSNSSAPISGNVAPPLTEPAGPGRTSPSISVKTPTTAPPDSIWLTVALLGICKSVALTNGAAAVLARDELSLLLTPRSDE